MSRDPARAAFLARVTLYRPVSVLMLCVAIAVVGALSYPRVPIQLIPEGLSMGELGVFIPVEEGTPQENMEAVAKPCEDFLRTLPGLRNILSSSGGNRVRIRLEFDPRYDLSLMVAEVRDRIERAKASWPEGVDRYFLWRHDDTEMPTYIVSMGFKIAPRHRDRFEEEGIEDYLYEEVIAKRLEAVQGVARVRVWGLMDQRVEIALDKEKVRGYGIPVHTLVERLGGDNRAFHSGIVRDGDRELLVRVDARFRGFAEIAAFPVDDRFRVGDFAEVRRRRAVRDHLSRVNGSHAKAVTVFKESGANSVDVSRRVKEEIAAIEADLQRTVPGIEGVETHAWMDQGEMIAASIDNLQKNALFGGAFAVLVLFAFFRRLGMTLLVTLAIPFSLLITVIWIHFRGGSFNMLSLMGLSLGVGMLVDNSIVGVENILRKLDEGEAPLAAAAKGVQEVAFAMALATLTTVVVFLPLVFLADPRFRVITSEIGIPLCVSVLASLAVALVFIPQGAIYLGRLGTWRGFSRRSGHAFGPAATSRTVRLAVRTLDWILSRRGRSSAAALLLLGTTKLAFDLVPKAATDMEGPARLHVRVELPKTFTLREADEHFAKIEAAIEEAGAGFGIRSVNSWFDSQGGEINVFCEAGRRVKEEEFFVAIRRKLPPLPGVTYRLGFEDIGREGGRNRLMVFVESSHFDALESAAAVVEKELQDRERFPFLHEVHRWREEEMEEVRIEVDRRAAQHLGIDTARVSRMVAWSLRGSQLPDYVQEDRELPLWLCYSDALKENVEEVSEILVFADSGTSTQVSNLARLVRAPGAGDIHRRRGKMAIGVSARVEGVTPDEARNLVEHRLGKLALPEGCSVSTRPPQGGFEADMKNAAVALGMALVLVFFVMGLLFESWILPLSVLFSVPFASFGALWLLVALRVPLDGVGMIGMLMLVGIVVNNAIVLVDTINRKRREGSMRRAAILDSVRLRFRPIWLTTLTTIFGLLPMIVFPQRGEGVDYKALAVVLVGGLGTSTFFTLFFVPLLYASLDDVRRVARLVWRGR